MNWENILKNQEMLVYKAIKKNKSPMHISLLERMFPRMAQSGYLRGYLNILIRKGKVTKEGQFFIAR